VVACALKEPSKTCKLLIAFPLGLMKNAVPKAKGFPVESKVSIFNTDGRVVWKRIDKLA
jgi:hypothetical protein